MVVYNRSGVVDSEVFWEAFREEGTHKIEDFVTCSFGAGKALQDIWTTLLKHVRTESVLGVVKGVNGEPVGFVEAFEAHCHT